MTADQPLRILIVDDEGPARRRLHELLNDCAAALSLTVIGEAGSGREALGILGSTNADLLLVDIHMPEMDGLELARHLLKLQQPPAIIFTTAFDQHALEAFDVHAVDYLVKPVRVQRLLTALQKVPQLKPLPAATLDQLPANARRFLSVTERSRVLLVPVDEIIYLKAELKYITIRTATRQYLLEESLTKLEEEFGERFLRIHRNCLIARAFVRGFERRPGPDGEPRWEVLLHEIEESLPVSRRQQHVVHEMGKT
jgi:two-component system response regulator AlgR